MQVTSNSTAATIEAGAALAADLQPGDILFLTGDLGAGKTQFVKGLARGLKSKDHVSSPTFVIIHEYDATPMLVHCDLYRLQDDVDPADIGLIDYINAQESVLAIEWPERLGKTLDKYPVWRIVIKAVSETDREITINPPPDRALRL